MNGFVDEIVAADPTANVIVLGDVNDFDFSETVHILEGGVMTTLMDTLPLGALLVRVRGNSGARPDPGQRHLLGTSRSTTTRCT